MAIVSPVPSPSNWQNWPNRSKPYMKKYNSYAAAAYLNSFLKYCCNLPTQPGQTYYGAGTANAVGQFQAYWGLYVYKEAGPITMSYVDYFVC